MAISKSNDPLVVISVSDIIKLLDQIPIWKRLVSLVKEVDELKARVAILEETARKPAAPAPELCPLCESGSLKVIAVRPHPQFGTFGAQLRTLKCTNEACGHTENRKHDPNLTRPASK